MTQPITIQTIDRVLSALDELTDDSPDMERAVDFYEELLPVMYEARPSLDGLALNPDRARQKLHDGLPLMWGEFGLPESIGSEPNLELFMTLCRLVTEGGNEDGEQLLRLVVDGKLNLKALVDGTLNQDRPALTELARSHELELTLLETVSRYLLSPIAWAYATAFRAAFDFAEWRQGYCPVCGAWPLLGEFRGRDKLRYLRCGCCGSAWKYARLQCVWCGTTAKNDLGFLYDDQHATLRIDVCHQCKGYLKTIVTFDALDAELLMAHDLKTRFLDAIATSEGYHRPIKQPLIDGGR